jgi:hypothetical protein
MCNVHQMSQIWEPTEILISHQLSVKKTADTIQSIIDRDYISSINDAVIHALSSFWFQAVACLSGKDYLTWQDIQTIYYVHDNSWIIKVSTAEKDHFWDASFKTPFHKEIIVKSELFPQSHNKLIIVKVDLMELTQEDIMLNKHTQIGNAIFSAVWYS